MTQASCGKPSARAFGTFVPACGISVVAAAPRSAEQRSDVTEEDWNALYDRIKRLFSAMLLEYFICASAQARAAERAIRSERAAIRALCRLGVVFRLGKSIGSRGPGLVLLIPIVDVPWKVDLREQYQEIPHQTCITKDNVTISVDFLIYYKVLDAVSSVVQVGNFAGAFVRWSHAARIVVCTCAEDEMRASLRLCIDGAS